MSIMSGTLSKKQIRRFKMNLKYKKAARRKSGFKAFMYELHFKCPGLCLCCFALNFNCTVSISANAYSLDLQWSLL